MQTSGANTTKRRVRRVRTFAVAAFPIVAMVAPLSGSPAAADPVSDTVCTVRSLLNILVEPCAESAPEPQPTQGPTTNPTIAPTANPSTGASASPVAPSKGRAATRPASTSRAEAPVQAGTIPPSQSAQPAPSEPDVAPQSVFESAPAASDRSPFALADLVFAGIMSGALVWLLAARRRRRIDDEAAEAARRVETMRDELLSNLSHEMFTPLTALMGWAQMIRSGRIRPSQTKKIADKLIDASMQLERTIDLLVTFAAVRGGGPRPEPRPVEVAAIAEQVASDHRARNPQRDVTVTVAHHIPAVSGDPRLVQAAIDQLVDNAIKFSPKGTPVTVAVRPGPSESNTVEVVVADRGVGIAAADLPHIFEEFHQLDGSSTRSFGGVGLGLTFASSVAELHGGVVEVESRPGEGSAFTLRLGAVAPRPVPVHRPSLRRPVRTSAA